MVGWGIKVGAVRMGLWGWGGCGAALVGSGVFSGRRIGMGYGQRGGLGAHVGISGHRGCRLCPYGIARLRSPGVPKGHTLWVAMGHILQPNRSPWGTSYSPRGHTLWVSMGHILQPRGSPWGTSYSPIGPHGSHPTARGVTPYGLPWGTSYSPRGHTLWSPWGTSYSPIGPHRSHPTSKWVAPLVPMGPLSSILQPIGSPWVASYSQMDHTL